MTNQITVTAITTQTNGDFYIAGNFSLQPSLGGSIVTQSFITGQFQVGTPVGSVAVSLENMYTAALAALNASQANNVMAPYVGATAILSGSTWTWTTGSL